TQEHKEEQEFLRLKKSSLIKTYFEILKSGQYKNYINTKDSADLKRYLELGEKVKSEEFQKKKEYMLDKKKFEKTKEYEELQEYNKLKSSPKIKWFYKLKNSNLFDELLKWEATFNDDFENNSLDNKKWLTTYYWGKKLLKESYSLENESHLITDGANLETGNSILTITTKQEEKKGKVWNPAFGFYEKTFEYTTGHINSGESFRQKYGLFKIKAKLDYSPGVSHAFWLLSDKMVPQIDIFNFNLKKRKKLTLSNYWKKGENEKIQQDNGIIKGLNPSKRFYIYSLEWNENELIWKINDQVVKRSKIGIPDTPMYINLNSGISGKKPSNLPGKLEVDWIKCYKAKE
ncbi:family 16 glycosylhydrolase, partial [Bacteroidota bacterium]